MREPPYACALLAFLGLALLGCSPTQLEPPTEPQRMNPEGVAIDGYSPVAYFTEGVPGKGQAAFSAEHDGVTYWLRNEAELASFRADPSRYVPAHGGWCTLMMGGSGRRTPGHPESFTIVDDRLMLFWSGDSPETRGMGLANWLDKTGGKIASERERVSDADAAWTRFLEGRRGSEIMLYKASDAATISAAHCAGATEAYIE